MVFSDIEPATWVACLKSHLAYQPPCRLRLLQADLISHVSIFPVPPAHRLRSSPNYLLNKQVEAFGYRLEPFARAEAFIEFLGIAEELLPATKMTFTFDNFVQKANNMAESMKDKRECLISLYMAFLASVWF